MPHDPSLPYLTLSHHCFLALRNPDPKHGHGIAHHQTILRSSHVGGSLGFTTLSKATRSCSNQTVNIQPRNAMDQTNAELVDLSLFSESPTREYHFIFPTVPRRTAPELPWTQLPRVEGPPVRRIPANKPLPPLPDRMLRPRMCRTTDDGTDLCILTRLRRCRTDGHRCPIQTRQQIHQASDINLTVLAPRARPASPLVWLEDEEMWLIANHAPTEPYYIPPFRSLPIQSPRPTYYPPGSRSPIPDMQRSRSVPDRERFSPMFAEAMQTVPFEDFESGAQVEPLDSPPPLYRMASDSETESSWRQSFHSAISGVSPMTADPSSGVVDSTWEGVARHWACVAARVARPASAMH